MHPFSITPVRCFAVALSVTALTATAIILSPVPTDAEEPPAGYSSELLVKAALVTGQLVLINRDPPIPDSVTTRPGITYGTAGDTELKLDLYLPKETTGTVPGLIFIHGGGWKGGRREDYRYYGVRLAENGFAVASITYRLKEQALFPAAVEDAKCAVRWLRKNAAQYHVNPDRIGVAGGSAGGHLSMMVGYANDRPELEGTGGQPEVSSRVQAVVNFYGPTDLTTPYARSHDLVTGFIGRSFDEAPEQYRLASPLEHLTADDPPTLTFHGTLDSLVPVSQADALVAKQKELGIMTRYERLEGWPHAMDAAQVVNDYCFPRMLAFFNDTLRPNEAEPRK
ncbi:MAG: alpha/beta hydrolase [Planctomycetaceae bacterium]|nr:alpha/beta hydrolase [Planctomycetaceae bacterium]